MFFLLYALVLLVFAAGWALGLGLPETILIYAALALLVSSWVSAARARRQAAKPTMERRRTSFPLQPTH